MAKSGKQLMSELAHTLEFLKAMGYDTDKLSVDCVTTIKVVILKDIANCIGQPTKEVKDAF